MIETLELIVSWDVQTLIMLALMVAGLSLILRLKSGLKLARCLGLLAAGIFIFLWLFEPVAVGLASSINRPLALVILLLASVIAYRLRAGHKSKSGPELRGVERTPLVPAHLPQQPDEEGQE